MNSTTQARGKKTFLQVLQRHDEQNRIAAELILSSPTNHSEIQREWARMFLQRYRLTSPARFGLDPSGNCR